MKELYESPELEMLCLTADERLASVVDFDSLVSDFGNGVSANPDIDIDIPL